MEFPFKFMLLGAISWSFADSVEQDQTATNVQSDLGSTLVCKVILFFPITSLKSEYFGFTNGLEICVQ